MFLESTTRESVKKERSMWPRRIAGLIGLVNSDALFAVALLILLGSATDLSVLPTVRLISCREFVKLQLDTIIISIYNYPEIQELRISETQRKRAIKSFKDGPLFEIIVEECELWLTQEMKAEGRYGEEIPVDDADLSRYLSYFMRGSFVEITDRATIEQINSNPACELLLRRLPSDARTMDKLRVSFGMVAGHHYCFKNLREMKFLISFDNAIIYEARPERARQKATGGE